MGVAAFTLPTTNWGTPLLREPRGSKGIYPIKEEEEGRKEKQKIKEKKKLRKKRKRKEKKRKRKKKREILPLPFSPFSLFAYYFFL